MLVKFSVRVKGTWETEECQLTPEQLKPIRRELRNKLRERLAKNPGKFAFHVTPIGEKIYQCASGTLTELTHAGICVGCLGCGRNRDSENRDKGQCEFCSGSGDFLKTS